MAILIEGMEMPKSCERCFIKPGYCPAIIKRMKSDVPGYTWIPANYRHEDCPLIEVPEPHGRLIDADAIPYKKIMYDDDDFYYGVTKPYIDRIPTVIPASEEVKT